MIKSVGIIGFGRFGQLTAKVLKKHFKVFVTDCVNKQNESKDIGVCFKSFKECAKQDVVILCVPISDFEEIVKQIVPFLKDGCLVIDVCSVKEKPVKIMEKYIPKTCDCLGTHPLFGPDTTKNGLKDKKIVICLVKLNNHSKTKFSGFLHKLGLKIIETTPGEHDKQMAKSLALIHFLGRGLEKISVQDVEMATPTHDMFVELVNIVQNDSEQLFVDMQQHNRFTCHVRKKLIKELSRMDGELDG